MISLVSISFYVAAWGYGLNTLLRKRSLGQTDILLILVGIGLGAHGISIYFSIVQPNGLYLGLFKVASLFFFVINVLALLSSLKLPLHNLFMLLIPLSVFGLVVSEFFDSPLTGSETLTPGLVSHILLSILAYSLLTIASVQALLLAYQNQQLKSKHFTGVMGIMPPLQTMESLLFGIVWVGFGFLSLSVITGFIFVDDLLAQKLSHKTVFSLISWLIYAILLAGHRMYGWRGAAAIRWVLGGFVALMLAYFGSKFVIEVLLSR